MVNGGVFGGGPQTSMYSQGIRKTRPHVFCWGLMMFNERRQLDTTKPPLEMMLQRVPRKRSPETSWANFAGCGFPFIFGENGEGEVVKKILLCTTIDYS